MKKKLLVMMLALVMVFSLTACNNDSNDEGSNAPETVVLTDNVGRQVELPYPVERSVLASRYNAELIRACGAIDKVQAADMVTAQDRVYWANFDPENVIGQDQNELDYEKIVALNPQVLLLPDNGDWEEAQEKLEPFGIKVFVLSGYDTHDFKNQVENIGKMYGVEDQAAKFYNYFNDKIEYIKKQLEGQEKRTVYFESTKDYSTAFPGSFYYTMLEMAGLENIFATDYENLKSKEIDPEAVIARNPDVIVKLITTVSSGGVYTAPTKEEFQKAYNDIKKRVGWDSTNAVKNDDIYFMTQFSHGGASKYVGAICLAKMVYPDLLPEIDVDEVYRAWLEDFQGFEFVPGHFYEGKDLH